jgi:transposase InsO family protein
MFNAPRWVLTDNGTQFKGSKFVRCYEDFDIHHQHILKKNGQVEQENGLILQGMKTRMFHDLEAGDKNWHKEMSSMLWALHTNINRATKDTPFNLVYGADAVPPPKIYRELARVAHFIAESQAEARELDSNLLEEKRNTLLANVQKYQEFLK